MALMPVRATSFPEMLCQLRPAASVCIRGCVLIESEIFASVGATLQDKEMNEMRLPGILTATRMRFESVARNDDVACW